MHDNKVLNKYKDMLIVSGFGVIAFGFWSVIKALLQLIFQYDEINARMDGELSDPEQSWIVYLIMIIVFILIILIRSYVGISARSEGLGKKKSPVYIIVAILILVFDLYNTTYSIKDFVNASFDDIMDNSIELIVDITSYVIMIRMIISAIVVKVMKKRIVEGKADE